MVSETNLSASLRPARLHLLALGSGAPDALAKFYVDVLGYREQRTVAGDLLLTGPERRLILRQGTAGSLAYAAFSLDSERRLAALRMNLQAIGVVTTESTVPGLRGAFSLEAPGGRMLAFGFAETAITETPDRLAGRLQHAVFAGPDIEAFTEFLVRIGFEVSDDVRREDGQLTARFLRSDDEHHAIAAFLADENRFDHHCYEAGSWNDIKEWTDHLVAQGVIIEWGPGRHGPGGNVFVMFRDPDGNWIEVSAELERVAEDRTAGQWAHEPRTLNQWGRALMRS